MVCATHVIFNFLMATLQKSKKKQDIGLTLYFLTISKMITSNYNQQKINELFCVLFFFFFTKSLKSVWTFHLQHMSIWTGHISSFH